MAPYTLQTNKEKTGLFPEKRILTWGKSCDTIKLDKKIKQIPLSEARAHTWAFTFGGNMEDDLKLIIKKLEKLQSQTYGKGNILIGYYIEQAKVNARLAKKTLEEET